MASNSGELSLRPGDKMYSVNGRTGTPPSKLQNYTVLITGSQDLVINLEQERKLPASCGSAKYVETSHSHVLATVDEKDEETVAFLPLDLELVEATPPGWTCCPSLRSRPWPTSRRG